MFDNTIELLFNKYFRVKKNLTYYDLINKIYISV